MSKALAVYHGPFGRATLYQLDRSMATHAHREGHVIFKVQGDDGAIAVCDRNFPLNAVSGIAVNPWQPHSYQHTGGLGGGVFLTLYIKPAWFLEAGRSARAALRFGRNEIEVTDQVARLVAMVTNLLVDDTPSTLFDGYLYELTHECFDQSWQWMPEGSLLLNSQGRIRDYRVRNSIRYMTDHLSDDLALDKVARESGLSRPHFFKLFRENVGLTPNVYLNTLRMEAAIARLTGSRDPVTSIGLDLGFASQASFTRFFVSNVGIAPTDYRRTALVAA